MKYLVTGGCGLLGRSLIHLLVKDGHKVIALTKSDERNMEASHTIKCDISDYQRLRLTLPTERMDAVFHCAAHIPIGYETPEECMKTNVIGAYNLLRCLAANPPTRLIYSSSMEVYGKPNELPTDEENNTLPITIYGLSKLLGERECELFKERMHTTILRYSGIYGERKKTGLVYNAMTAIKTGAQIMLMANQTSDFVWVEDVAKANILSATGKQKDAIYNIGGGRETAPAEIAEMLEEISGKRLRVKVINAPSKRAFLDIRKAETELGYKPTELRSALKSIWEATQ